MSPILFHLLRLGTKYLSANDVGVLVWILDEVKIFVFLHGRLHVI